MSILTAQTDDSYKDLISHAPDGEYSKIAPMRVLSFDIECAGRKGIFPEANIDPVIQIAAMVTRHGTFLTHRPADDKVKASHSCETSSRSTPAPILSDRKCCSLQTSASCYQNGASLWKRSTRT